MSSRHQQNRQVVLVGVSSALRSILSIATNLHERELSMHPCLTALHNQPVSVALDGGDNLFRFYKGGILSGACGTELDHSVAAVGYGVASDGTKYWIVKNSWGTSWGEAGYIRMGRDIADEEGLCGIAMQPSYSTA